MNILTSILDSDISDILLRCKEAILNFHIRDLIEILILAAMIFCVARLIKGRKAGTLAIGISVIVLLLFLSMLLDFTMLYKVFSSILGNGMIVLFIIFQPEIREALEKIGSGSINGIMKFSDRRKKKEKYQNAMDNIVSAVKELSSESTGALIVIERSINLSDIVETGVAIDANVNDLLIRNLFYNRSPLHDGALVVSGDRISAAACFLPLTERTDLDSSLGTRHRAAIGMAERSDAIVIVVSEETGSISIAHDFTFFRNVSLEGLSEFLNEHVLRISCNSTEK